MPDTVPPPMLEANEETMDSGSAVGAPVSFERWAKLAAKLYRRSIAMRAALIHEADMDEIWTEVDNHWFRAIESDLERGSRERLDSFLELVTQERARRDEDGEDVRSPCEDFFPPEKYPPPPRPTGEAVTESTPPSPSQTSVVPADEASDEGAGRSRD
jgi:hypothetical protein